MNSVINDYSYDVRYMNSDQYYSSDIIKYMNSDQ